MHDDVMRSFFVVASAACLFVACDPAVSGGEGEGESGEGEGEVVADVVEEEPNGGTPVTAVNDLGVSVVVSGAIDPGDDADFFHVEGAVAGHAYRATLTPAASGGLSDGKLVVLDDGRNGDDPGADYVRIHHAPDGGAASVEFAVLGAGSVYVAVQDDAGGGAYTLVVVDITADVTRGEFAGSIDDELATPGSVRLYELSLANGADAFFDLQSAALDARLFVVSTSLGDWIARNDDRSDTDKNPLIDAPLFEDGPYLLLVENNEEAPASLTFSITR